MYYIFVLHLQNPLSSQKQHYAYFMSFTVCVYWDYWCKWLSSAESGIWFLVSEKRCTNDLCESNKTEQHISGVICFFIRWTFLQHQALQCIHWAQSLCKETNKNTVWRWTFQRSMKMRRFFFTIAHISKAEFCSCWRSLNLGFVLCTVQNDQVTVAFGKIERHQSG